MATAPSYEYSGVVYTGDGTTTQFALTSSDGNAISYLLQEHITVDKSDDDGETWEKLDSSTDYSFSTQGTQITVTTAPVVDEWLRIKRTTPKDENWVDYQSGNLLTAGQLNEFESWQLYIDQELSDQLDNLDGSVTGDAVKAITAEEPIEVDSTTAQKPKISIDQTDSTGDSNALTSDTRVMSEKAIDDAFKQYIGTSPSIGEKEGQIRIDNTGSLALAYYWNGNAWVQVGAGRDEPGPPGPAPGLQDPPASAANVPLNADGSLGTATAAVSQDPNTFDLKFLFGIPVGQKGETGPQGPKGEGVTYKGIVDATTAAEPVDPFNGDLYLNNTDGTSSWTGLSTVTDGDRLLWNESTDKWDRFERPDYDPDVIREGDNVSLLANDANYTTAQTLQQVLDTGNTSTTDLWVGTGGATVKLLNTGNVEASATVKGAAVEATGDVKGAAFRIDLLSALP